MKVLHVSAECFPAAKVGGLADVVGALPKYLNASGGSSSVIIPKYRTDWLRAQTFSMVHKGTIQMHLKHIPFSIAQVQNDTLGFPLFVVDIPEMFDRPDIYLERTGEGYTDQAERFLAFQMSVLDWLVKTPGGVDVIHCHDHHTGFIPFFMKFGLKYQTLRDTPTVFTIHNAAYHGSFSWEKLYLMPWFEHDARPLLDWNHAIDPLATAIKTAWRVTTVSPNYLEELKQSSSGLEWLLQHEQHKASGILNGIDNSVWSPESDEYIEYQLEGADWDTFKANNKRVLAEKFEIDPDLPILTYIGRLAYEKGSDLLPDLIKKLITEGTQLAILVLGTGDPVVMDQLLLHKHRFSGRFNAALEYNEALAHQLYAGSDFLLMPSRVEPCGLNQMYAMRYGTIPIVRAVGGLKDTVIDLEESETEGSGIRFEHFNMEDSFDAVKRGVDLFFQKKETFKVIRERIAKTDFSWELSTSAYDEIYQSLIQPH